MVAQLNSFSKRVHWIRYPIWSSFRYV